jgi:hypothetical protein
LSSEEIIRRIKEKFKTDALLLVSEPLPLISDSTAETTLLFQNEKPNWVNNNERYLLYKVVFK